MEYADQRLYRLEPGGPRPVTPPPDRRAAVRYADFDRSPDGRWLAGVRETHHGERADQVVNEVVAIPADGVGEERVLATGHDFYAAPRWSPDGRRLAFVTWDHPNMPWDATKVVVVTIDRECRSTAATTVAGGAGDESVLLPRWSPEGVLLRGRRPHRAGPRKPTSSSRTTSTASSAPTRRPPTSTVTARPSTTPTKIERPIILFQGLEDEIVPPWQAEAIVAALDAKGLPYAYLTFEGEQHGFRRAENQRRCLEAELAFYGRIFAFDPADALPHLEIANLEPS